MRKSVQGLSLQHFYVPINQTTIIGKNPVVGAELYPLPLEAIYELISVYVTRELSPKDPDNPASNAILPSASAIFPNQSAEKNLGGKSRSQENYFCIIQNPTIQVRSEHKRLDGNKSITRCFPTALFVEFSIKSAKVVDFETPQKLNCARVSSSSKAKWDPTILWSLCRWRSCLSHSTNSPAPKYLCSHHTNLKALLDNRIGKASSSESSRFLPKKPPTITRSIHGSTNSDLEMIKAASSLLQELLNGKLASTIQSFCQRAARESSDRFWLKQSKCLPASTASWSRWADSDKLEAAFKALENDMRAARNVLEAECATTMELKQLENMDIYPTAELTLIRKEARSLDNEIDEVDFCRHKLALLRSRREAVEAQLQTGTTRHTSTLV